MAIANNALEPDLPARLPLAVALWLPRGQATAQSLVQDWLRARGGDADLQRDAHGRPWLRDGSGDVSWSHCGDALLAAHGEGLRVGVDIERLRPRPRALDLARRFFHPDSLRWLQRQPDVEAAFVRLWCAHEAVLKAHGKGLAFGLAKVAFADAGGGQLRLLHCDAALGDAGAWSLHAFAPAAGLHAALAWRAAY